MLITTIRMIACTVVLLFFNVAWALQDLKISQLEYIANHVSQTDCRQIVASLRSPTYDLDPRYIHEGNLPPLLKYSELSMKKTVYKRGYYEFSFTMELNLSIFY